MFAQARLTAPQEVADVFLRSEPQVFVELGAVPRNASPSALKTFAKRNLKCAEAAYTTSWNQEFIADAVRTENRLGAIALLWSARLEREEDLLALVHTAVKEGATLPILLDVPFNWLVSAWEQFPQAAGRLGQVTLERHLDDTYPLTPELIRRLVRIPAGMKVGCAAALKGYGRPDYPTLTELIEETNGQRLTAADIRALALQNGSSIPGMLTSNWLMLLFMDLAWTISHDPILLAQEDVNTLFVKGRWRVLDSVGWGTSGLTISTESLQVMTEMHGASGFLWVTTLSPNALTNSPDRVGLIVNSVTDVDELTDDEFNDLCRLNLTDGSAARAGHLQAKTMDPRLSDLRRRIAVRQARSGDLHSAIRAHMTLRDVQLFISEAEPEMLNALKESARDMEAQWNWYAQFGLLYGFLVADHATATQLENAIGAQFLTVLNCLVQEHAPDQAEDATFWRTMEMFLDQPNMPVATAVIAASRSCC